jgi:hypothetical protein
MAHRLRPCLTYANVVSTLCLFLVLGGGAFAAARITGRDIVNGSVGSADLRNNGVRGRDIRNGTIRSRDVKDKSLLSSDFSPGSLPAGATGARGATGPRGANGSPDTAAQVGAKLKTVDGPGSGIDADLLDGRHGGEFVGHTEFAGGDLSGTFTNLQIAIGSVGHQELRSGGPFQSAGPFNFSMAAGACATQVFADSEANRGEIVLASPEQDFGAGVYVRPTVVGHGGEVVIETCNSTASTVNSPLNSFFDLTFVG